MDQKQLQAVMDKMAIQDVLTAYCRGVDRMDYGLVRACYTEDAHDDHGLYVGPIDGFIAWMAEKALAKLAKTEGTKKKAAAVMEDSGDEPPF